LRQFIARNRFPTTPSYYRARDGRYKLVLPYPDEHQARQALKALPETLQLHGQPWIRSMADVQKDML
jgi:septal ring-binding cell division protein DamX